MNAAPTMPQRLIIFGNEIVALLILGTSWALSLADAEQWLRIASLALGCAVAVRALLKKERKRHK